MLARCSHCESTFVTQQFGRQRCPKCGVEVLVEDPRTPVQDGPYTPPAAPVEPPAAPAPAPATEPIPWERRAEIGRFRGLTQTIAAVLTRPSAFFTRLRYDTDEGILSYFAWVVVIPLLAAAVIEWKMSRPEDVKESLDAIRGLDLPGQLGQFKQFFDQYGEMAVKQAETNATWRGLIQSLITTAATDMIMLFVIAGIVHGLLTLLRGARGGWTATLKTCVYAATPLIFAVVPWCGTLIGGTWATGLQIYGLSKAHKTSMGIATAAVLGLHFIAVTCICGAVTAVFSLAGMAAGH